MPHVMTVLGPISAEKLGPTDAHSHAWIETVAGAALTGLIHDDESGICRDLKEFYDQGGRTIVDCQPGSCGRNGRKLRSISQITAVNIIACTGFHLRRYYPPDSKLWNMPADQAYNYFLQEAVSGLVECRGSGEPVYPGFIKIAAESSLAESPLELFRAVSAVSKETGLAIEMHTEKGAGIEDFLDFFISQGLHASRLIFCHVDKRPDLKLHLEMAQAGVLLEYDTFIRPKYKPEEHVWPLLLQMIGSGFSSQIALATDLAETSQWSYLGGSPGAASFFSEIRDRLAGFGVPPAATSLLTGGNIARRLAITGDKES